MECACPFVDEGEGLGECLSDDGTGFVGMEEFVGNPEDGWNYSDGTYEYFDLATLEKLFDTNGDGNTTDDETIVIGVNEYSWSEFLAWWNDHENNEYYRTPLDGEWVVLLVLACAYVFAIYVRRRKVVLSCTRARVGAHRDNRKITILLFVLLSISIQAPGIHAIYRSTVRRYNRSPKRRFCQSLPLGG